MADDLLRLSEALVDHLVGKREQLVRDRQAEHLGGREIDGKIKFGRLLNRYVGGLRTAQNFIDKLGRTPKQVREVWSVGHESSGLDESALIQDRRQPRAKRE